MPMRVLIVEDDAIVAAHLERVLAQMGYEVTGLAATGEEGVDLAGKTLPDIVLMDVRLRGAMNGVEAAVQIAQRWNLPVVYLTAYSDDPLIQDAKRARPYGYLTKPVRDRELRASLEMAHSRHQTDLKVAGLNRVLRMMRDVNQSITRLRPAATLIEEVCRIISSTGGYALVAVASASGGFTGVGRAEAFLEAASSLDEQTRQALPCAVAAQSERSVVWNELPPDIPAALREAAVSCGIASAVGVPLRFDGRSWGVLCVYGARPDMFFPEEVALLEALATDIAFALKTIEDEGARREAEEARAASERRYRDLVESLDDVVYTLDPSGTLTFVSGAATRLFGYAQEELVGRHYTCVVHADDADDLRASCQDLLAGCPSSREYRIIAKDGSTRWVRSRSRPVVEEGRIVAIRGVLSDVTERRDLEELLRRSQRLEALGQLAGGVAHDFNNVLQAIVGYVSLALRAVSPSQPVYGDLKEIERATSRASTLTRQLLAFSRRQTMEATPQDLNDVLASLLKMLRRVLGEHIELEFLPASSLPTVAVDAGQIEQAVLNLALNARDAMPEGGRLVIRTETVTLGADCRLVHPEAREGAFVVLRMVDTGVGMSDEVKEHAFEPFFTTKAEGKGTGLGLAMVYGIVRQHGGFVGIESAPGQGTAVSIFLPAAASPEEEPPPPPPQPAGGHETILIAEDEDAIRSLNTRILSSAGYRVLTASDGEEAIALFDAQPDAIDLAMLDVVMPRQGGLAVLRHLRKHRPSLPVVFSSGYSDDMNQTRLIQEEGFALLRKPFSPHDLLRTVREVLHGHVAPPGERKETP